MHDPQGLYWLGPLAWSMAFSVFVGLLVGVVFLVGEVRSPRARRNRAKLRAYRRAPDVWTVEPDVVAEADRVAPVGRYGVPIAAWGRRPAYGPSKAANVAAFLDEVVVQAQLADAGMPHILVALDEGTVGPASGPFEDLWQATAAAPVWERSLNDGLGIDGQPLVEILVVPLFAPGT